MASYLKILPLFTLVMPGMISRVLSPGTRGEGERDRGITIVRGGEGRGGALGQSIYIINIVYLLYWILHLGQGG